MLAGARVSGRRVRLPVALLYSRHHSHLAVMAWALCDLLGRRARDELEGVPVAATRRWLAARLDVSESGLSKALGQLTRPHAGTDPAEPDAPVWLVSTVRGCKLPAARQVIAGVPSVHVPEASLGDGAPVVNADAWRLYAVYLHQRHTDLHTVAHSTATLAAMLGVRPSTITRLRGRLVAAGLVVMRDRPGLPTVVAPLLSLDADGRAAALAALDHAADPVHNPVDHAQWILTDGDQPPADLGTAPPASMGTAPPASIGMSIGEARSNQTRSKKDPGAVPARTTASRRAVPAGRPRWSSAVSRPQDLPWCGRCAHPQRRLSVDEHTGHPTAAPCPACAPEPSRIAA